MDKFYSFSVYFDNPVNGSLTFFTFLCDNDFGKALKDGQLKPTLFSHCEMKRIAGGGFWFVQNFQSGFDRF